MQKRIAWAVVLIAGAAAVRCSQPADAVLECSASDIRHVLRIRADDRQVDDLSFTPAKLGEAEVSDTTYLLHFLDSRDHYELIFQIDRSTGIGTRELFDDEQQPIRGHGGSDEISCKPYSGTS